MKNLHLYKVIQTSSGAVRDEIKNASHFTTNTRTGQIFFITSEKLIGIQNGDIVCDYEFDSSLEHDSPVVCFDYLSDTDELFWIYQNGHCYRMNVENWDSPEDPGVVFEPVWGASWSPGYQNLAVATENTLLLLSRELDVISEAEVRPDYAGKEELQTIGWGSKETQFQGLAGKSAREKADKDRQLTQIFSYDQEQFNTSIRWRADGQIFAVSSVEQCEDISARRIRIWDSDLNFLALCDPLSGIEPTLEVLPSRNLFVTSRVNIDTQTRSLWFYEQNGQYRRHFEVPKSNEMNLKNVQTNCDGTILALVFENLNGGSELQFWTMSNTQWSPKLSYRFESTVIYSIFSEEFASNFQFLTSEGVTMSFDLGFVYNSENGCVVSVNGGTLKLTDLNKAPIPPPMSHYQHRLDYSVSSISIDKNIRISVLNNNSELVLLEWRDKDVKTIYQEKISIENGFIYDVKIVNETRLSFITLKHGEYTVESIDVETKERKSLIVIKQPIIYHHIDGEDVYAMTDVGRCYMKKGKEEFESVLFETNLADFFNWKYIGDGKILGLSPNFNLYINGQSIAQNCSSFSLNGGLCLFTTFEHKLHVLDVLKEKKKADEGRKIERGAVVVGHEGTTGTKCWLQMPRGNLEGIHPRFLTLTTLKTLLDNKKYLEALIQMRKHRINMNLIVDHNPQEFYNSANAFIDQFSPQNELHMDLLQLVILGLEEEDCTSTVFKEHYEGREQRKTVGKVEKTAKVLENIIREKLDKEERNEMLYLTLLSCLVRQSSEKSATVALLDLKERSSKVASEADRTRLLSLSLRHLSYIVDPNKLFEAALRTFDLNILSMIADKLQKDPKEYIPLIKRLKGFQPEEYRRFHVCLLLEDWPQALDYVSKVPERFEECCQHIKQYGLYARAIRLFKGSDKYKDICALSADYYYKKAKFTDAAFLYKKCEQHEKALQAYESAQNVQAYCDLYDEITPQLPKARFDMGLKKIAIQLEQKGRTDEAAEALIRLGIDSELAANKVANLLATAGKWQKLIKLGQKIPETTLSEILKTKVDQLITLFKTQNTQILEYQERLLELRDAKQMNLNAWIEGQGDDAFDCAQSETTSIASSMMSQASRMSTASSRRRRNVDKKKSVVKKGSQYEDAAILLALKSLYQTIDSNKEEIADLLKALVATDLLEEATSLQHVYEDLINTCISKKNSIWPEYLKAKDLPGPIFETFRCEDGIVRLPEANSMPPRFQLSEELIPPQIRTNVSWKLEILQ